MCVPAFNTPTNHWCVLWRGYGYHDVLKGPGEAIVRIRWADGHTATGVVEQGRPWVPERPVPLPSPWLPLAAVAVGWRAPARLLPFAAGLMAGGFLPGPAWPLWLAASVVLAARERLVAEEEPASGALWPLALGLAHGAAVPDLAWPTGALALALVLHRVPGLPWLLGSLGAAGVLAELLP